MPYCRVLLLWATGLFPSSALAADKVEYERDVKPILRAHCFRCHGPLKTESGLRLDTKALALKGGENGPALVPRDTDNSRILQRITGDDASRMPPEGAPLSQAEIGTLKTWIAGGAVSPADEVAEDPRAHWAYQPIQRAAVPAIEEGNWSLNPIDAFIAHRHRQENITPRPVAARHVLLRRVSLDLTGLPPSRKELREFLADTSPAAYQRAVDRLLASPHYGERWGRHWLDVWRYSDWYGFQNEVRFSQKNIWHWRDWVVDSLNSDKGYQRMVMEMLAGDEIVPFDPANLRATGFLVRNRNTDSREQWIRDTVEHTAKAFLALTMGCVQCHDHPYDPVWHDEYYRFRNIFEPVQVGIDSGGGGAGGIDLAGVARIFDRNKNAATRFYLRGNDRTPDKSRKIIAGVPQVLGNWREPSEVHLPALARIPHLRKPVAEQTIARLQDNIEQGRRAVTTAVSFLAETKRRLVTDSVDASKPATDTLLVETFRPKRNDGWREGPGQWEETNGGLAQTSTGDEQVCWLEFRPGGGPLQDFTLRVRFRLTGGKQQRSAGISFDRTERKRRSEGLFLTANPDKPGLGFYSEYNGDRTYSDKLHRDFPVSLDRDYVLRVDARERLVNVYVNDVLQQAYQVGSRQPGAFRLWTVDGAAEFFHLRIDPLPADVPMAPADSITLFSPIARLDKSDPTHLSFADVVVEQARRTLEIRKTELASHQATWAADTWKFLEAPPPEDDLTAVETHRARHEELAILAQQAQRQLALSKTRETLFLAEQSLAAATIRAKQANGEDEKLVKALADVKKTFAKTRSQLEAAEKATREPGTPRYSGLSGSYGSSSGRRLSLARWVADEKNPLTARVAVNHIWLRHFGQALVPTVFNFGLSGKKPSHPQLLDWLSVELREPSQVLSKKSRGWVPGKPVAPPWSMKHLHRLLVTSRTYRSASSPDASNLDSDPDNVWLWRMPAQRMDAETVRDSVLAVAGTLDRTLGGPDLPTADGMSVARRSLYFHHSPENRMTFLKLFDGADPAECYHRHVSIIPHQALALFNSELSVVQSRKLTRQMSPASSDTDTFIQAAFEQVLSRQPSEKERTICHGFLSTREAVYRSAGRPVPENSPDADSPAADPRLHARENLVHALLNHHDFVTIK